MKLLLSLALTILAMLSAAAEETAFYVGTYTKPGGSQGIYHYRLNLDTGAVTEGGLAAESKSPSFLALHPNKKFLYACNEAGGGSVSAFAIEADGKLRALNQQSSKGGGPAHVWVDGAGKYALVANYGGGSIAALPIKDDGSLGEATGFVQHTGSSVNPKRQKEPHAHAIYTDASNQRVYVCDLGLDKVLIYRLDEKGTLTPSEPASAAVPPGSGPRHMAFAPKGGYAYVINELLSTVTAFKHDAGTGALTELQTISTLPAGFSGNNSTAEIFAHPNGKFLYGSNRGHDSIAVFAIGEDGKLTPVDHTSTQGKMPRNFGIDPSGKFLLAANQGSDNVVVFRIDAASGKLTPAGHSFQVGAPVCVTFVP